ncbi:hypothetical protein G7046_g560 [Stylonectria norvegica]|nr:hypothetical protein G7046_g560 [Stylonectria norvegica]
MADSSSNVKVGVIIGSQRVVRSTPQVAKFILDVVQSYHGAHNPTNLKVDFALIDIATYDLPLAEIPTLPSHMDEAGLPHSYGDSNTQSWSSTITSCDAFIFVTPQYNWGMPAALKNALDHIFHEFGGKPAMVVAYGGQGGTISAAMLITVLSGMFARVIKRPLCMNFADKQMLMKAIKGEDLGLDASNEDGAWAVHKDEIVKLWEELKDLLAQGREKPSMRSVDLSEMWQNTWAPVANIEKKHNSK